MAGDAVDFTKTYRKASFGYTNPVDYVGQVLDDGTLEWCGPENRHGRDRGAGGSAAATTGFGQSASIAARFSR